MPLIPRRRLREPSPTQESVFGYHDGQAAFVASAKSHDIYTVSHETIHDLIFFCDPDGHLGKFASFWRSNAPTDQERFLAQDLNQRLTDDSLFAHESVATYVAAALTEAIYPDGAQPDFSNEYRGYFALFNDVLDNAELSAWFRATLAFSAGSWAFSSPRSALISPSDWLVSNVYDVVDGPNARLCAWRNMADIPAMLRGWIESGLAVMPASLRDACFVGSELTWLTHREQLERIGATVHRALFAHLRHAIPLPTHPRTFASFRTTRRLIRSLGMSPPLSLSRIFRTIKNVAVFRRGGEFELAETVNRLQIVSARHADLAFDQARSVTDFLNDGLGDERQIGIAVISEDVFIIHARLAFGFERHQWRAFKLHGRGLSQLIDWLLSVGHPVEKVVVITACDYFGGWKSSQKRTERTAWFRQMSLLEKNGVERPSIAKLERYVVVRSGWAQTLTFVPGTIDTTLYELSDGSGNYWIDVLRPSDPSIPFLISVSPRVAWQLRHPLMRHLSQTGHLKEDVTDGNPFTLLNTTAISMTIR